MAHKGELHYWNCRDGRRRSFVIGDTRAVGLTKDSGDSEIHTETSAVDKEGRLGNGASWRFIVFIATIPSVFMFPNNN